MRGAMAAGIRLTQGVTLAWAGPARRSSPARRGARPLPGAALVPCPARRSSPAGRGARPLPDPLAAGWIAPPRSHRAAGRDPQPPTSAPCRSEWL